MAKYEVTTALLVHTRIKVIVEADNKDDALDAASDLLPSNYDLDKARQWKATVALKPPKGLEVTGVEAFHFEATAGGEKVKRIA